MCIRDSFNIDHPKDFKGHSLSVSDVVVLHQNGQDAAHFVDSVGFRQVPEFLQEQKQLTPDDLETGETIKTPRGTCLLYTSGAALMATTTWRTSALLSTRA